MSRQLSVLLSIILIDSISLGFVFTNLPTLLARLGGEGQHAALFGLMMAAYAALQFLCSPVLGALSDRFGRKPILLLSIVGALIDFATMAFGTSIATLFVGRMIGGATSANAMLISAFVADLTDEQDRAQGFGRIFAAFGLGLVIGPAAGGHLGEISASAPFVVAILAGLVNLFLATVVLHESHRRDHVPLTASTLNPFSHLLWALRLPFTAAVIPVFLLLAFSGSLTAMSWPIYTPRAFGWSPATVGLSLSALGICNALAQGLLIGPLINRLGERTTIMLGMASEALAMLGLALAGEGWMVMAMVPLFALGGVALPTAQSLASIRAGEERQGEIQGVLASGMSLMMAIAPLAAMAIMQESPIAFPGVVWCVVPLAYLLLLGGYLMRTRGWTQPSATTQRNDRRS